MTNKTRARRLLAAIESKRRSFGIRRSAPKDRFSNDEELEALVVRYLVPVQRETLASCIETLEKMKLYAIANGFNGAYSTALRDAIRELTPEPIPGRRSHARKKD